MDDQDQCKLFVGGFPRETTEEALTEHFRVYGTVVNCVIVKDTSTGKSRGFAFVIFSDRSGVDGALADASHYILGRKVEVKKAIPRRELNHGQVAQRDGSNEYFRTKKIFVGGLPSNLTEQEFKAYFEEFGSVSDVVVMRDYHRPRGFGFITFDSEEAVEDVLQRNFHVLSGKYVEVKRAVPKQVIGPYMRGSNGGEPHLNGYQQGYYPMYSPNRGPFPIYGSFPAYCGIGGYYPYGVYPTGGYSGFCYGPQWQAIPLPYGGPVYPGYPNVGGGLMGIAHNGYNGPVYPAYPNVGVGLMGITNNGYNGGIVRTVPTGNPGLVNGGNEQVMVEEDGNSSQVNGGNEQVVVEEDRDDSLSSGGSCSGER